MQNRLALFLCVILILIPILTFPHDGRYIRFEHLYAECGGKSIAGMASILQDREGFLWFGTGMGLAKYDGYTFTCFNPPAGQKTSSQFVSVYPILEDREGDIWVGTNGEGLFRFIKENETFVQYKHDPDNPDSLGGNIILALAQDKKGKLWIGTRYNGLCCFDSQTQTWTAFPLGQNVGTVWDLMADTHGDVWIGTQKEGLFHLHPDTQEVVNYRHDPDDPASLGSNTVWSVLEDKEGTIWVGTNGSGLNRFVAEEGKFVRYYGSEIEPNDLGKVTITALQEDDAGRLWIGTAWDGLRVFEKRTGEYIVYKHDPRDQDSLSDDNITSVYQDASGMMWIGTSRGGINKTPNNQVKFHHYKHNPNNPSSISQSDVLSIHEDRSGFLWIGLKNGVDKIDPAAGSVTRFTHDPANPGTLSKGNIQAILEDKDGIIWLGHAGSGLDRLDPRTGIFTHLISLPGATNTLSNNQVNTLCADKQAENVLWIGTQRGLNKFNSKTQRFSLFMSNPEDPKSLTSNVITALFDAGSGYIWVGTKFGLNRLNKRTGKCTQYVYDSQTFQGVSVNDNLIHSIYEDNASILWIGTARGINRYDEEKMEWKYYTSQDGLPGDVVCGIQEDENGNLWVSTNRGLSRFDTVNELFINYSIHDGMQGDQFNFGSYFKSADGRMFFGGENGYNGFYPRDVRENPFVPPIVWTAFYRNNRKAKLDRSLSSLRDLGLSYKSGFITFEFAALSFFSPALNQFAYKLEGRDEDWVYVGPNRAISFPNLNRGEYVLHVKGANPDGVWNEEGISIDIRIIPPFWKTSWFVSIMAVFASAVIFAFLRWRKKLKSIHVDYEKNLKKMFEKHKITRREQEIVRLIIQGARNKDIEKKLFISDSTVRNHIYNIYQKLGVQNRIELINFVRKP